MDTRSKSVVVKSDESQLEDLVIARLRQSPYRQVREVGCQARGQVVTLVGRVSSFYYKQLAQSQLQGRLSDMVSLVNRLEVVE